MTPEESRDFLAISEGPDKEVSDAPQHVLHRSTTREETMLSKIKQSWSVAHRMRRDGGFVSRQSAVITNTLMKESSHPGAKATFSTTTHRKPCHGLLILIMEQVGSFFVIP